MGLLLPLLSDQLFKMQLFGCESGSSTTSVNLHELLPGSMISVYSIPTKTSNAKSAQQWSLVNVGVGQLACNQYLWPPTDPELMSIQFSPLRLADSYPTMRAMNTAESGPSWNKEGWQWLILLQGSDKENWMQQWNNKKHRAGVKHDLLIWQWTDIHCQQHYY